MFEVRVLSIPNTLTLMTAKSTMASALKNDHKRVISSSVKNKSKEVLPDVGVEPSPELGPVAQGDHIGQASNNANPKDGGRDDTVANPLKVFHSDESVIIFGPVDTQHDGRQTDRNEQYVIDEWRSYGGPLIYMSL